MVIKPIFWSLFFFIFLYGEISHSIDNLDVIKSYYRYFLLEEKYNFYQEGYSSYYSNIFNGRITSSGRKFSNTEYTIAHRNLPFNTFIILENPVTKRRCISLVTDRGPFVKGRIVDMSVKVAKSINRMDNGKVKLYSLMFKYKYVLVKDKFYILNDPSKIEFVGVFPINSMSGIDLINDETKNSDLYILLLENPTNYYFIVRLKL